MTFINDNGDQLNFDGQFAITKRSISFFDGKIKGDTSTNFSIDNNSVNRKTLGYYGPQMLNQIAATKQAFNRIRNGNIIDRGYIVIQDEYDDVLDCYYVSGNSNWIQLLTIDITTLDYTGLESFRNYAVQMTDVAMSATTGKTFGIVFPIADWWANYQRGLSIYSTTNIVYGGKYIPPYTTGSGILTSPDQYSNPVFDFYPCFYVSSLIDEISAQTGIKITGTLLQDQLYKTLIIPPTNGLISTPIKFSTAVMIGNPQVIAAGPTKYTSFTERTDPDDRFTNGRFTSNCMCSIKITVTTPSFTGTPTFAIYENDSGGGVQYPATIGYAWILYLNVFPGDFIDIYITGATTISLNLSIEQQNFISYSNYVLPSDFLPKIKCIDIIKTLINILGCSAYFDDFTKTLTLNIIEKYKLEDAQDWSNYYLSHRSEYTVNTSKHNYLNLKTNNLDSKLTSYNNVNLTAYGAGDIITDNNLSESSVAVQLPFSASYFDKETDNSYMSRVPLVQFSDGESVAFTAISNVGSGESSFTVDISNTFETGEFIRIVNTAGTDFGLFRTTRLGSQFFFPFYATDTGFLIRQNVKYNNIGFYLLSNSTINCWDLYPGYLKFGYVDPLFSIDNRVTTKDYATFAKFKTGLGIDRIKNNLCIDDPNISGFSHPSIREQYLNKISNFFVNPPIRSQMLLPEAIYQSFIFDKFISIKSKKLTGDFYVENIANYIDGNTPVEVNLYLSASTRDNFIDHVPAPVVNTWQWFSGAVVQWFSGDDVEI